MKNLILISLYHLYKIKIFRNFVVRSVKKLDGGEFFSEYLRKIYNDYHGVEIGIGTYGGCFNPKVIHNKMKIGKYCSFAPNVYFFNANHPKNYITTHPFLYNTALGVVAEEKIERSKLEIGNDVWMGQNAIIVASAKKIGNGAIIAAGAIVTKDVPDYAVVAGVPAKIIDYRFDKETIEFLNNKKWWEMEYTDILKIKDSMYEIEEFRRNSHVMCSNYGRWKRN